MSFSSLAIILLPFTLIIVSLVFITLNRYIGYKERVELARLGYSLAEVQQSLRERRQGNRGVLWGGVITSASGLALLIGLGTLGMGAWLIGGLLPLFVGLGMVIIYLVTVGSSSYAEASSEADECSEGNEDQEPVCQVEEEGAPWDQDAPHEE